MSKIRVRFAPSPTGHVHVGNARTALFNWLFARHHSGVLVLRIEDTDVERSQQEYETQLLADLRWFGLDWDEGPDVGGPFAPYRQSQRLELYRRYARQLIEQGRAYRCFCSAEQLEAERQEALKAGRQPKYSGRCQKLSRQEAEARLAAGEPAAIRLKITPDMYKPPSEEEGSDKGTVIQHADGRIEVSVASTFRWTDLVHAELSFPAEVIGDPILVRSDGHPAYNYAVVIDDHLMEITHVIRGDDHISNTPRQLALYRAFDWQPPEFAHLSTILGPDRARLSKRHGASSLQNFREMGILPEALRNYLALLGWSPADGTTEILSPEQLVAQFSLERVIKSPAVFDAEKLHWMNRHYMKVSEPRRLAGLSVPFLARAGYVAERVDAPTLAWLERVLDAVLKNLDHLSQLPAAVRLIFEYDAASVVRGEETRHVVEQAASREVLAAFLPKALAAGAEGDLTYERFRGLAKSVQQETGKKGKDLFHPIRVALTGAVSGPELEKLIPIFEAGAKRSLPRHVKSVSERLREFAAAAKL